MRHVWGGGSEVKDSFKENGELYPYRVRVSFLWNFRGCLPPFVSCGTLKTANLGKNRQLKCHRGNSGNVSMRIPSNML